ncbi:NAD-P-binding protein [Irpex lacteus]|nr:NAD-P-binding protein [Irpex lacteus]
MPSYAITGASRGLGLGFIKALSSSPSNVVFAIIRSRSSASQLEEFIAGQPHNNIRVIEADNLDFHALQSAADAVSKVTGGTLDVLINNSALMMAERSALTLDAFPDPETLEQDLVLNFRTNTLGPIHTINAFLPLLRAGSTKKCLTISTTAGSPKVANKSNFAIVGGYGISKAGLNLAVAKYAARFREEGIVFLAVTPGMVKTMPGRSRGQVGTSGGDVSQGVSNFEGPITVEQSIRDILAYLDRATIADSGKFTHRDGRDGDHIW